MTTPAPPDLPAVANRPGLDEIRTRIGTHDSFLSAMLARLGLHATEGAPRRGADEDPALALCDAWASIADILTFYQERIANESYLRTAKERRSVAEIGRLVDYRLRPGVAAGVALAFTLEPDAVASLPVGTSAQSVPVGDERARRYELVEPLEARAAWNRLAVRATRPSDADTWAATLYASGVTLPVRVSDGAILFGKGAPRLRRVTAVTPDFPHARCRIDFAPEPGSPAAAGVGARRAPAAAGQVPLPTFGDLVDHIRTGLAQAVAGPLRSPLRLHQDMASLLAPDTDVAMRLRGLSVRDRDVGNLFAAMDALPEERQGPVSLHAMRIRTAPFGSSAPPRAHADPDWPLDEDQDFRILHVEAMAGDIMPGSWVAFEAPGSAGLQPPRRVLEARVVTRVAYGLSARCTRLVLDGSWLTGHDTFARLRAMTIYAGSVEVPLAEEDDPEPLGQTDEIELDGLVGGLPPGRTLIVEGELADHRGAQTETVMLVSSRHVLPTPDNGGRPRTVLRLSGPLTYLYRRRAVSLWGNVGRATEGETVEEVLGGGRPGLSRRPLTYVSAPTASGALSTLRIRVNGVTWREVASLSEASPSDRVFVTVPEGIGPARIQFGNGVNGARPPGTDAVQASYRTGLGAGGNCEAGRISQLLSRPAGVRAVTNPRPASGGADPEDLDAARARAAVGVVALSRLVGLRDYEDFARDFAGVGKADAVLFQGQEGPTVVITVAGPDSTPIAPDGDLVRNLAVALERYGDLSHDVVVLPARLLRAVLSAYVRLLPDHAWERVGADIRAELLDRFGFVRRTLGQTLWHSEVVAAIQGVEGVADVRIDMLAGLGDPVTTTMLRQLVGSRPVGDVRGRRGRLGSGGRRMPLPAEVACFSGLMPELISLAEIGA